MWNDMHAPPRSNFGIPFLSKSAPCSPVKALNPRRVLSSQNNSQNSSFHVVHKIPVGDSPYVRAKHVQLVDKDPDRAIALFWSAINSGDRIDSALKDMAIVMKQQNRPEEAIEAIKSLRHRCSDQAQESLDNVLLDLYKRCGRLDDQIALLKHKLDMIHQGVAFNGRRTKTARSQGKKFQVSIEQEATRLLGNLGWAYMQQNDHVAAEAVYRKALAIEPDNNKVCNLGICLMKQCRVEEAKTILRTVTPSGDSRWGSESHIKSYERAQEMLREIENQSQNILNKSSFQLEYNDDIVSFTSKPSFENSRSERNYLKEEVKGRWEEINSVTNGYELSSVDNCGHSNKISAILSSTVLYQQQQQLEITNSQTYPTQLFPSYPSTDSPAIPCQAFPYQQPSIMTSSKPPLPLPLPSSSLPASFNSSNCLATWENGYWTPPSEDYSPSPEEEACYWFNKKASPYHHLHPHPSQHQEGLKWHAETLRKRLEVVSISQNDVPHRFNVGNDTVGMFEPSLIGSNLRADAPPFPHVGIPKSKTLPCIENKKGMAHPLPLMTDRSSQASDSSTLKMGSSFTKPSLTTVNEKAELHEPVYEPKAAPSTIADDRTSQLLTTPPGLWASLGFTESPKRTDFAEADVENRPDIAAWKTSDAGSVNCGNALGLRSESIVEMETVMRTLELNRQRRLKIFQDLSISQCGVH